MFSLHIFHYVRVLTNSFATFWISHDSYSAEKSQNIVRIKKAQMQGFRILAHWCASENNRLSIIPLIIKSLKFNRYEYSTIHLFTIPCSTQKELTWLNQKKRQISANLESEAAPFLTLPLFEDTAFLPIRLFSSSSLGWRYLTRLLQNKIKYFTFWSLSWEICHTKPSKLAYRT